MVVIDAFTRVLWSMFSKMAYWISEITGVKVTAYDVMFFYMLWLTFVAMVAYAWGFEA